MGHHGCLNSSLWLAHNRSVALYLVVAERQLHLKRSSLVGAVEIEFVGQLKAIHRLVFDTHIECHRLTIGSALVIGLISGEQQTLGALAELGFEDALELGRIHLDFGDHQILGHSCGDGGRTVFVGKKVLMIHLFEGVLACSFRERRGKHERRPTIKEARHSLLHATKDLLEAFGSLWIGWSYIFMVGYLDRS